jgi:pimeloyl-ACP methyl ester carboxylesterase
MQRCSRVDGFQLAADRAGSGPPVVLLFTASIAWYRAGSGTAARVLAERSRKPEQRISSRALILWPEHNPLFPPAWSDRVPDFFSHATVRHLAGIGHFVPVEAPQAFAAAVMDELEAG